jgi:hypothetical protein
MQVQSIFSLTEFKGFDYNIAIGLLGKNIYPAYHGEREEINCLLIMNDVAFARHNWVIG